MTRLGFVALARPTFDTETAAAVANAAYTVAASSFDIEGSPSLMLDSASVAAAAAKLEGSDAVVVAQATFTDSTLPGAVADALPSTPIILWGFPEQRSGGRLALNSLCGINLAAHHLVDRGVDVRWVYERPEHPDAETALHEAAAGVPVRAPLPDGPLGSDFANAIASMSGATVGLVGEHPNGFQPCGYDSADLARAGNVVVDRIEVEELFDVARHTPVERDVSVLEMVGLEALDASAVQRSIQLHRALVRLSADRRWDAVATRCWPECFDEYGSAACTAQSLLTDAGIPATCEADVLGAATALALQHMTGGPAFVADLVDVDGTDGTVAFWHCGIAPPSMAHPADPIVAMGHPNRGLPLINQFRLRPGRVIVGRISRGGAVWHTTGEVLDRPRPYHGTSAVVRLDIDVDDLLAAVISNGMDHHYALAYL